MGALLYNVGAQCREGGGLRSESMLHGETCTLDCRAGFVPSVPQLTCLDGTLDGYTDTLACAPPVIYDNRPLAGGLVVGAVTGGSELDACLRAQDLKCEARFGGSAVLVQLPDLSEKACRELFLECQGLSSEFEYMQHTVNPDAEPGLEHLGTCTLGCFEEVLPESELGNLQFQQPSTEDAEMFAGASTPDVSGNREKCVEGPVCIDVSGSCNEADNGDYYRYPFCTSGYSQWVQEDESHRLRYDGTPAFSQGGKWIMEQGADPNLDGYGLRIARQPSFFTMPLMGEREWRVRCRRQITALTFQETFEWIKLTLGNCSCTDEQDCSGHGTAYGEKATGPNCDCICDVGYKGAHCEIKQCKVPDVLFAADPPCREGRWLNPGQNCTPLCNAGYESSYSSFTCGLDGQWPADKVFQCIQKVSMGDEAAPETPDADLLTTTLGPCTDADCSYRGKALGIRLRNGTCLCECFSNFTGMDCSGWVGSCAAPRQATIANSYFTTCEEGTVVKESQCTARCVAGYIPIPSVLECRGTELDPPTFRCIGTTAVYQIWCESIKYIAIGASCVSALSLLVMAYCFGRTPKREVESFIVGRQLVEVGVDEEGKYNLVRMDNTDMQSKLPRGVISAIAPAVPVTNNQPLAIADGGSGSLAITSGVVTNSALERHNNEGGDLRRLAQVAAEAGCQAALDAGPILWDGRVDGARDASPGLMFPTVYEHQESAGQSPYNQLSLPGAPDGVEGEGLDGELAVAPHGAEVAPQVGAFDEDAASPAEPSGRFRPGQHVSLCGLIGHQALNGVQGLLVEFDHEVGVWVVELEGFEEDPKRIPEKNLQELQLSVHEAVGTRSDWHFQMHALTEKADAAKREHERQIKQRQGAATAAAEEFLRATENRRESAEDGLRSAFASGDAEALREHAKDARQLLEELRHCPAGDKASLIRLLQTAESRLEQHDAREASRAAKKRYEERVQRGEAADWKMTPKQFWQFVEQGNVEKVRGGIKSKMPLSTRSTDGKRHGIVHVACKRVLEDALAGEEKAASRLAIVEALLQARANANAVDASDLTPLELAMSNAGDQGSQVSVVSLLDSLRALGLRTAAETAAELRAQSGAGG